MIAGRYSLTREIGRGGTGAVWLGRDEVLGRQVAIKRIGLLPGADRTDLARAEREARLSAHLNHPHVVTIFDVVVDGAGDRWLIMEYVDGVTLGQLVRDQGPLTADRAAPLLRQAADALVAAHRAGIAHRDVKPSNILVDADGQVKLTDFGIARVTSDPLLTQTGLLTGSPAYLAPEVATGSRGDAASDVWSLGATAFHLLAGHPPYDVGEHVLGAMYRIVHEEPPRLADAGWLAPLLRSTMVRDPQQRWSMEQVRDFLDDPSRVAPTATGAAEDVTSTQVLGPVATPAPTPSPAARTAARTAAPTARSTASRAAGPARVRHSRGPWLAVAALVAAVALAVGLYAALANRDPGSGGAAGPQPSGSAASASASKTPAAPTAAGMQAFIRRYVATVADDPDTAWRMLTPKFQRESGGLTRYRAFWGPAQNGRLDGITADPTNLTVSYRPHFDNWRNGSGQTVLDLVFDKGTYRIDGEHSKGFDTGG